MSLFNPLSNLPFTPALLPNSSNALGVGAKATTATSGSGSGTSGITAAGADIGSTFLSLLVQELQNQDPTAPMDSTAMVGQMISLNQLNQLTSIDQVLSKAYGSTTAPSTPAPATPTSSISPATQAALRLLNGNTVSSRPAVSTSVTLPAS